MTARDAATSPATAGEAVPTTTGDGDWHVTIGLMHDIKWGDRGDVKPICVMDKADYELRNDGSVPSMRFETSILGVVDFEHDTAKFALVELAIPHVVSDYYGRRTIVGVVTEARLYPAGVNPLEQSDRDTQAEWGGPDVCGYGPTHGRHRFAPYLPPQRDETTALLGRVVRVELSLQKDADRRVAS